MKKHLDAENINDDILTNYQSRRTKKQKKTFIKYLKKRLDNTGYGHDNQYVETYDRDIFKSENLIIGNLETSKVILTAHYDTVAWNVFPNILTPKTPLLAIIIKLLILLFILLVAVFIPYMIVFVVINLLRNIGISCAIISCLYLLGFVIVFIPAILFINTVFTLCGGFPSKHTANDNTSGVILLTKFLENLPVGLRKEFCVVYFDNEEKGLLGSRAFKKLQGKMLDDKLILNFDCVGDGEHIVSLAKNACTNHPDYFKWVDSLKEAGKENNFNVICEENDKHQPNSDQKQFKHGVGVCSLFKFRKIYIVGKIHTPKDIYCKKDNIKILQDALLKFASKIA